MEITPLENWIVRKSGIGERSREKLDRYQLGRVLETLDYAKSRSRFYGERLKSVNPDAVRGLEDMRKIPFTFPHEIQENPFRFLCVPQGEIARVVTLRSTGTSGNEKRIFFAGEDLDHTIDFFSHGMRCLTDETDRVMVLLPGGSEGSIGYLLKKALEKNNTACFVYGVAADMEETANEIVRNQITSIVGIPVQVLNLSRLKSEVFKSGIKSVLLSTDYVPEVLIRELGDTCDCRVFTHYGMTETGYGGGVECRALNGYHMREADLYFEIVDPFTGESVRDGEWGEVVFTTLNRKAMPLIRYRTGDIAAFSAHPCACGTFLKTMKRVKGRLTNRIGIGGEGFLYLPELDEAVFFFREVRDYRACLTADGSLDIAVVTESDADFQKVRNRVAEAVGKLVEGKSGRPAGIKIIVSRKSEPDKIKNSMAKRTFSV